MYLLARDRLALSICAWRLYGLPLSPKVEGDECGEVVRANGGEVWAAGVVEGDLRRY